MLGHDYSKAMKVHRIIKEEHARVLQDVDFLITPTTPLPAPRIDSATIKAEGRQQKVRGPGSGHVSRNTSPMNATGFPAITVPCGFSELGLPIGLQFIGRPWEEGNLVPHRQCLRGSIAQRGRVAQPGVKSPSRFGQ